ncbi:titin isoform X2 [Scomber scombrus]|uniref:titin isoform X2 n=1 Tax=Scomber scombrus TaxID=13677 RepID=UPI002DD7D012|nr:titin isoform X2 [Scomber scombrus]
MWHFKVFSVIYFTAVCATADPVTDDYDDATTVYSATVTPTVYQAPTPSLLLQSSWSDVFLSEKVEFSCNVSGSSDWTFTWHRDGNKVQDPDPNLSFAGPLLTITASRAYAGNYACKGHHKTKGVDTELSNLIELNVEGNKPKPTVVLTSGFNKMFPGESVTFKCMVDVSSGWNYLWYHNGIEIEGSHDTAYTIDAIDHRKSGQYHCKAKRGKGPFITEQSDTITLLVSNPSTPTLEFLPPWLDLFKSERVEMRCKVDSDDWKSFWYRDGQKIQEGESTLIITSVSQTDKGVYTCKAQHKSRSVISESSNSVKVTVYDNKPKPTVNKNPPLNPMYVGEKVNFTCKVAVSSGWKYVWYKDGKELTHTTEISSIHLSDGGKYSCKAIRGGITSTVRSDEMTQDVLEIPIPTLKLKTPWSDVFPTENVELTCQTQSGSDWTYTWYRDGRDIQKDNTVSFDSVGGTLSISSASVSHEGQYQCKGHLSGRSVSSTFSSGLAFKVYDKKPSVNLTQDPDYKVMFPEEAVSFNCDINVSSGWEYLWLRDGIQLPESSKKYTINSVAKTNSGSYTCKAKRGKSQVFVASPSPAVHLEIKEKKPKPSVIQQPNDHKVYNGESVSFTCTLEISSGWEYSWYKDQKQLIDNNRHFNISHVTSLNNGTYTCMARRNKNNFTTEQSDGRILNIHEIPVPLLKRGSMWLDVFPDESISLICGMKQVRDEWTYKWYRDRKDIKADDVVSFDEDGTTLSISSASISHRGQYSCSGKLKSRPFQSSHSPVVTLHVYERPRATIVLLTGWSEVFSTDSLILKCEVQESRDVWNYTWSKAGKQVSLSSSEKYVVTPQNNPEQGSYSCQGLRTERPSYSEDSSSFATKNLLLKRRVLLSISGCLFFGMIAVVIGCIVLRVTRKPVKGDDKPDETELFLTMAQLKDRGDAPCPMVEYITDEALNAPSKEGDEKDPISSESTSLPITSEEDQAATAESLDTAENNGGLVSFKQ